MDEPLREFLTERFSGLERQLAEARQEGEEARRQAGIAAEALRDDIRLIAEGHSMLREMIQEGRRESDVQHREIMAAIKFSYAELDRRITRLEAFTVELESRLSRLERAG